jgi:hypothetical protein
MVTKEQAILHAQHLYLIYSQSGTLYDIILYALRSSTDPHKSNLGPHVDGVVGSISSVFVGSIGCQLGQLNITSNPPTTAPTTQTSTVPIQTSKVNLV